MEPDYLFEDETANNYNTNYTSTESYATPFVLALCSMFFAAVPLVGLIIAIIGLVKSNKARKKLKQQGKQNDFVIAAFDLSITGLVLSIILMIILFILPLAIQIQAQNAINKLSSSSGIIQASEKTAINSRFEKYEGTQRGTIVKSLLLEVKSYNNSETERQIELTGIDDSSEIDNSSDYEVTLDYDYEDIVDEIRITKLYVLDDEEDYDSEDNEDQNDEENFNEENYDEEQDYNYDDDELNNDYSEQF